MQWCAGWVGEQGPKMIWRRKLEATDGFYGWKGLDQAAYSRKGKQGNDL